jgi:uncharacterized protein YciI
MNTYFVYKLIPPRPTFAADMSDAEATIMKQHVEYWHNQLNRGTAIVFGPVADPSGGWGLAIVQAQTEQDVRDLGTHDPAIKSQQFSFDVYPMPGAIARS